MNRRKSALFLVLSVLIAFSMQAQQVAIPKTPSEVPGPIPGDNMTDSYVKFIGRMAYMWGYPLVNAHNRRVAFRAAPAPGLLGGVLPLHRLANSFTYPS